MNKISIIGQFFQFMKVRKKYWLAPILIVFLLLGMLLVFGETSVVAPFIYTLF